MEKAHTLWTYRYEQTHFEFILKWYKKSGHVVRVGEERGVYRVLVGKPEGKNHWGDLGVDGWIILGWISRRWVCGYMDWIGLVQDRDGWRTLVSAVMNLRVP
jgi:hypothetical protein